MEEILKEFLNINQILNSIAYVFVIYFYFKINYELKLTRTLIETINLKIENEIKSLRNEIEIRDRKLNLLNQKFSTEIEALKTKLK